MTTMTPEPGFVTGGVDTHVDLHVAAAVDHLGRVLGTETFPTTNCGYRHLSRWLRSFGPVHAVGVEGTGSYGSALAGHLTAVGLKVIEVSRPNRQVGGVRPGGGVPEHGVPGAPPAPQPGRARGQGARATAYVHQAAHCVPASSGS